MVLTKLIIWISGFISWIPYTFSKEIVSFWDYDSYYVGKRNGLAIGYSIFHIDQSGELIIWIKNYVLFASKIDGFGVIEYLTLFDKDVYQL
jgi:hypothetical protein